MATTARARYPALFAFLEAWIADADLAGHSDTAMVAAYLGVNDPAGRAELVRQGRELLAAKSFPWRAIGRAANRRFAGAAAAHAWLSQIDCIFGSSSSNLTGGFTPRTMARSDRDESVPVQAL